MPAPMMPFTATAVTSHLRIPLDNPASGFDCITGSGMLTLSSRQCNTLPTGNQNAGMKYGNREATWPLRRPMPAIEAAGDQRVEPRDDFRQPGFQ